MTDSGGVQEASVTGNMDSREDAINDLLQARSEIDEELRRHKTKITVLFTDVVGSTQYFDRFGDTAGLLMLHRHDNCVSRAVAEFDGTVIKTIGDSVMAEFPQPLLAVRAAIEIQRRLLWHNQSLAETQRLQTRTGINCGVGFRRSDDLFGDAVNIAARITKRSGPGQILISRSVQESLAQTEIGFKALGRATLGGKVDAEEIYEVLWNDAPVNGEEAEVPRRRTPSPPPAAGISNDALSSGILEPVLPRYQILERVGMGGVGVVFKACDRETGEIVALKVLRSEIGDESLLAESLKNELRLARKITHKNVCRIYDFNRSEGIAFITMEFVQGESLRRVLDRFGALNLRKAINVARQICDGLYEAHSQSIVHRDLKPENLMIDEFGNVKLMDFGLAHLVARCSSGPVGTPSYMAPEQLQGRPIDQRADIYALGLVLFELFTGAAAFTGDTPIVIALKHIHESPRNPQEIEKTIPERIAQAILRCLEEDPAKRFQSVEQLRSYLIDETAPPHRDAAWKNISPHLRGLIATIRMRPRPAFALAGCGLLGFTLIAAGISFHRTAEPQPPVSAAKESVATDAAPKENQSRLAAQSIGFWSLFDTVAIPGGVFMMGNDEGKSDERPQHRVKLKPFRMSRTEVTNRQYVAFLEDSGYQRPKDPGFAKKYLTENPNLPVVNVSYQDAIEFCKWATRKFGMTVRLPTEAEWEYAASGGKKNSLYPWGMESPKTHARYRANAPHGIPTIERAGFAPNGFGLYNMSGNVWEWVADFHGKDYYQVSPIKDPAGPATGQKRVIRGGSWADDEPELTVTRRSSRNPNDRGDDLGFRIVTDGTVNLSSRTTPPQALDTGTNNFQPSQPELGN